MRKVVSESLFSAAEMIVTFWSASMEVDFGGGGK